MSLQEPSKKMSKSDEDINATINLTDDADTIVRKFKRAVTDNVAQVKYDEQMQPGISNLMAIYSAITNNSYEQIENEFAGKGYGDFKLRVAEAVISELEPLQKRYKELTTDKAYIDSIIKENASKANFLATKTLRKVQKKIGFPPVIR